MSGTLELLALPFLACLLIAGLHCYLGLHIVKRGVIFVDLALAQAAALGATVALVLSPVFFGEAVHSHAHGAAAAPQSVEQSVDVSSSGGDHREHEQQESFPGGEFVEKHFTYSMSLLFAFLGAALFALGRFTDERVPHEAIIGIVFVVCAALSVLILSKAPHGHERLQAMLVGSLLFVTPGAVLKTLWLYLALGLFHFIFRQRFLRITSDLKGAEESGVRVRFWDFLFYAAFGLMVTQSVRLAGVLVVFTFLIIPAVCASMFFESFRTRLIAAWVIAVAGSAVGLLLSAAPSLDFPTGPALVSTFGAFLVIAALLRRIIGERAS